MKDSAVKRIGAETTDLPERWREVLQGALLSTEFSSEAELLIQSALAVHTRYPANLEPAEAILAGDAYIPMAVESMLQGNCTLAELEKFLSTAVGLFDK